MFKNIILLVSVTYQLQETITYICDYTTFKRLEFSGYYNVRENIVLLFE